MRNNNPSLKSSAKEQDDPKTENRTVRHDVGDTIKPVLHNELVTKMAVVMLFAASIILPLSSYAAFQGEYVPLLVVLIAFFVSPFSIISTRNGRTQQTLIVEVFGFVIAGAFLSLADPNLLDPGLGMILLGPVHFMLARGQAQKVKVGPILIFLSLFAGVFVAGWLPLLAAQGTVTGWTGTIGCVAVLTMQFYSASELLRVRRNKERAQNTAVRHLAEQMGDGYARFSRTGSVIFASDVVQEFLGTKHFELMGNGLLDRVHILDRPAFLHGLSDVANYGASKTLEVRMRQDDPNIAGSTPKYLWVEIFFSPVVDHKSGNKIEQVVALFRDVTCRKDHEFKLIEARQKAEDASNTKSGFLATIGHELRTPLNAIVGFSEMMTNGIGGTLEPAHEEYAKLIHQSGHHLLDVVNMLLDMSKIEAGKFELQLTSFDPEHLIDPCLQMMQSNAQAKGVHFVTDIPKNLPEITGDERACRQILINLLSNAVKFSSEGNDVQVRVKRQGQKLSISVTDTGIGMSKEAANRVGEAFFQAHDGLSRQYEGTGLGLSIVRGLVDLHEGTVKIDSELGRGTTISVLLPIHGPQSKFVEPEIITPLVKKTTSQTTQPGSWPEQKRIAQ